MKKLYSTLSLILAGSLLLASCSASNGSDQRSADLIKGAYLQTLISLPQEDGEAINSYHVLPDGKLVAYDYELKHTYTSTDVGATWTQSDGPVKAMTEDQYANQLSADRKGGLYLVIQDLSNADGMPQLDLYYADSAGDLSPVDIPELTQALTNGSDTYINRIASLSDDRLLLSFSYSTALGDDSATTVESGTENSYSDGEMTYHDVTAVYDPSSGAKVFSVPDFNWSFAVNAKQLFNYDYEEGLQVYDLQTGQPDASAAYTLPGDDSLNCMAATDDGTLFALINKDIYKLSPDGSHELLLAGDGYSFGRETAYVDAMHLLPDQSLLLSYSSGIVNPDSSGSQLLQLKYDPEATIDPAKTLKIWGLNDNETFRDAVIEYRREHPDSEVTFDVALNWDGSVTQEDAVKTLNNLILTGDGPDVLLLDGLTVKNYADRGLLLDLSKSLDLSDLLAPVAAASQSGKAVYWVPSRFELPVLMAISQSDLDQVTSPETLLEVVKAAPDMASINYEDSNDPFAALNIEERSALGFESFDELFKLIWDTSAVNLIGPEGLDESVLEQMLTTIKTINDKCGNMTRSDFQGYSLGYGGTFSTQALTGSAAALLTQRTRYGMTLLDNIAAFEGLGQDTTSVYKSYPGIAPGSWLPVGVVGINAASEVKDLALDLVKALLSAEVQSGFTEGMPVTQAGMDGQISTIDKYYKKLYDEYVKYLEEYPENKTPEVLAYLEQIPQGYTFDISPLMTAMQQPLFTDQIVYDKVQAVALAYCQGQQSPQAAASQLQQDLHSYLAEQD